MKANRDSGFSYVEVMIAAVIVAIALVPGMRALSSGFASTDAHLRFTEEYFHITTRLEELLALPLSDLEAEALRVGSPTLSTDYSDASGASMRRVIYLSRYDADNADGDDNRFTGVDEGLVWIKIQLEGTTVELETLTGS